VTNAERALVHEPRPGPNDRRSMAGRLQSEPTAYRLGDMTPAKFKLLELSKIGQNF
jgi:hypothetical protein